MDGPLKLGFDLDARFSLENEPRRELDYSRVGRGRDLTEQRARDVRARIGELRVIENVERLRPDLELDPFTGE